MTLRRIQCSAIVVILFTLFLVSGVAQPKGSARVLKASTTKASKPTTWVFEGCWERYLTGPCRDVYRDEQGNYWICSECGTTGNPGPNKCTMTNLAALDRGFWCS